MKYWKEEEISSVENKVKRTPSKSIEKLSMEEKLNGTTGVGGVE